jgi:uncharacterized protein with GYD domain
MAGRAASAQDRPPPAADLEEVERMFRYVGLIQLTPEGREHLKEAPKYLEKIKGFIVEEGGEVESIFAMMGPWDFFAIVKYPTIEAAFRALAKIGTLEVVKTETFPVEEIEVFVQPLV